MTSRTMTRSAKEGGHASRHAKRSKRCWQPTDRQRQAPSVVSLRALLHLTGAHEWRIKGRLRTDIRAAAFLTIKVLWVWCRTDPRTRLCEFGVARDSSGR